MGSLSGFLTNNWTLKASAFGLALLLWVAVRAEAPSEGDAIVPVRVDVTDPAWTLVGEAEPAQVTVHFAAPASELVRMAFDPVPIVIPVDQITSGDTVVVLRTSWVRVRDGVVPTSVEPPSVRLVLEPMDRGAVPAEITFTGLLPEGLAMAGDPVVDPAEIGVVGPRSRVIALESVPLSPIDLGRITGPGVLQVPVDTLGFAGFTLQPRVVSVELPVAALVEREIRDVPVIVEADAAAGASLQVLPESVWVVLRGASSVLDRLEVAGLTAVVQIQPGSLPAPGAQGQFPLALPGLPRFVSGEISPSSVTVRNGEELPR